jgi:glutathione synthase/RimK-type ligase-like ATP-grasp enzyme
VPRGYAPAGQELRFEGERVFKWSNRHCGDDKARQADSFTPQQPTLVEPFFEGTSERILIVGDDVWHLTYESEDWRKNVAARVRVLETPNQALVERARHTARTLGLRVVGVDYLVTSDGAILLEINAYPGLSDVPGAEDAFVADVARWWSSVT